MQKKFLVFGLGNPGEEYAQTFHNAGWQAIEKLAFSEKKIFQENKKTDCQITKIKKDSYELILAKPQLFMNLSGIPLKKISTFYKIEPAEILLVHDDADLPLGTLRFSFSHGSGGHKGVESIFQELGHQNFYRLRIGIGRPKEETSLKNFVLRKIGPTDEKIWEIILEKATLSLWSFCENGYEKTASLFNGKN